MKRAICAILALIAICSVSGCRGGETGAAPAVLDEKQIQSALLEVGLPGRISEAETFSTAAGGLCYSIRDPDAEDRLSLSIFDSPVEGKCFLKLMFFSPPVETRPSFAWQDWQKQLQLASLLSGGAEGADALYQTFSKMDPSISVETEVSVELPAESFSLEAPLPPQYALVQYSLHNSSVQHSFPSATALAYSQRLVIYIFRSQADYANVLEEKATAKEAEP